MPGYSVTFEIVDKATQHLNEINKRLDQLRKPLEAQSRAFAKFANVSGLKGMADGFKNLTSQVQAASAALGNLAPALGAIAGAASIAGILRLTSSIANMSRQLEIAGDTLGETPEKLAAAADQMRRFGGEADDAVRALSELQSKIYDAAHGTDVLAAGAYHRAGIALRDQNRQLRDNAAVQQDVFRYLDRLTNGEDRRREAVRLGGEALLKVYQTYRLSGLTQQEWFEQQKKISALTAGDVAVFHKYNLALGEMNSQFYRLGVRIAGVTADALTPFIRTINDFAERHPAMFKAAMLGIGAAATAVATIFIVGWGVRAVAGVRALIASLAPLVAIAVRLAPLLAVLGAAGGGAVSVGKTVTQGASKNEGWTKWLDPFFLLHRALGLPDTRDQPGAEAPIGPAPPGTAPGGAPGGAAAPPTRVGRPPPPPGAAATPAPAAAPAPAGPAGGTGGGTAPGYSPTPLAPRSQIVAPPGAGGAPGTWAPPAAAALTPAGPATPGDPRGMIPIIRAAATANGVDPDVAVRVAQHEGLNNPVGDRGRSGGAFQLFTGGGEGNRFQQMTGKNPLDPANEADTIWYSMQRVRQTGWGPWHGAARAGVRQWEGIGPQPATTAAATPMAPGGGTVTTGKTPPGVNPELHAAMAQAWAEVLPAGYTARVTSGVRGNEPRSQHFRGSAEDWQIFDEKGRPVRNRGADTSGLYQQAAIHGLASLMQTNPALAKQFAWGGHFGTAIGGGGEADLMHYDIGGVRGRIGDPYAERAAAMALVKQRSQAANGTVNVNVTHRNPPEGTTVETGASGSGVLVGPTRIEHQQFGTV